MNKKALMFEFDFNGQFFFSVKQENRSELRDGFQCSSQRVCACVYVCARVCVCVSTGSRSAALEALMPFMEQNNMELHSDDTESFRELISINTDWIKAQLETRDTHTHTHTTSWSDWPNTHTHTLIHTCTTSCSETNIYTHKHLCMYTNTHTHTQYTQSEKYTQWVIRVFRTMPRNNTQTLQKHIH